MKYYTQKIANALRLAIEAHDGQLRKYSGLPYIVHPMEVHDRLVFHIDNGNIITQRRETLQCTSYLHDVYEDCPHIYPHMVVSATDICVHRLVHELTNPSKKLPHLDRAERKRIDREALSVASQDAKIIKLIDRTCNVNNMIEDIDKADHKFLKMYCAESMALLNALQCTNLTLERDLLNTILQLMDRLG